MMSTGISVKSIKNFDGTNFQGWKAQLSALFVLNGVADVISGARIEPVLMAGADAVATALHE